MPTSRRTTWVGIPSHMRTTWVVINDYPGSPFCMHAAGSWRTLSVLDFRTNLVQGPRGHHQAALLLAGLGHSILLCLWPALPRQRSARDDFRSLISDSFTHFIFEIHVNLYKIDQKHGIMKMTQNRLSHTSDTLQLKSNLPCFLWKLWIFLHQDKMTTSVVI